MTVTADANHDDDHSQRGLGTRCRCGAGGHGAIERAIDGQGANTISLARMFDKLDANADGPLSDQKAQSNPAVGSACDSFDTRVTIEDCASGASPAASRRSSCAAGMQASTSGGVIGAPASGGDTYKIYPDGSVERKPGRSVEKKDG